MANHNFSAWLKEPPTLLSCDGDEHKIFPRLPAQLRICIKKLMWFYSWTFFSLAISHVCMINFFSLSPQFSCLFLSPECTNLLNYMPLLVGKRARTTLHEKLYGCGEQEQHELSRNYHGKWMDLTLKARVDTSVDKFSFLLSFCCLQSPRCFYDVCTALICWIVICKNFNLKNRLFSYKTFAISTGKFNTHCMKVCFARNAASPLKLQNFIAKNRVKSRNSSGFLPST